jgi:hypothetical protein
VLPLTPAVTAAAAVADTLLTSSETGALMTVMPEVTIDYQDSISNLKWVL